MTDTRAHITATDGSRLGMRRWRSGSPRLFFVHGFAQGSFVWRSLADFLPEYPAAAIDLRGHGDSDHDPAGEYSLRRHVEDVVDAVRLLGADGCVLIGHSMGAEIALLAAEGLPRRPSAVVLIDGGPELNSAALAYIRDEFRRQPRRYSSVDEYAAYLEAMMPLAPAAALREVAVESLRCAGPGEFRLKVDRAHADWRREPSTDAELWSILRRAPMPILVIRGAGSALCHQSWASRIAAQAPLVRHATVARAGHAVMLDNPVGCGNAVQEFLLPWLSRRDPEVACSR
jgi:pimeloyl-ACP methyl ester carboxylesterase